MEQDVYLLLEDGTFFQGKGFGATASKMVGEVVFTTSMVGYLETLSDPSYYGQIIVQTFPMIGNYGVIFSDFESRQLWPKAYIVREWCQYPSNFRSEGNLDAFFRAHNIQGMYGIDTRALTRIIREHGAMNGMLTTKAPPYSNEEFDILKKYHIQNAVEQVSRVVKESFPVSSPRRHIVLWDFGTKQNIIRELNQRGCTVTAVPARSSADEILSLSPDGIMLSNGPGDPAENLEIISQLQELCKAKIPIFGICLGHQLLALSQGGKTEKLKYGHRGANQPVKDTRTGRVYITSQNHGYAVKGESLPNFAEVRFLNLNDGTCEGIDYKNMPAFSVQFHPEACSGPLDTEFLFDRFMKLMDDWYTQPKNL